MTALGPETIELFPQRVESLGKAALDLRFEQTQAIACSRIGHVRHYRVCFLFRKVATKFAIIVSRSGN